ncbi:FAD-dependent monooxygenase [Kutzneria kofuensis]|uniref:2-polyprenyl-6-methoxyphenol hydroxylase-like FAD-dependent oxidoreductase n=1 Tax=Kutzneria kofuensis TaxID=103725 RepID=A0A7W9KA41_9PSEU|nr:FAD-dependent monooxygenase [Kutzneria kofuensis]MBB5888809.1 2-polyprenyl-6-methoxyphenol hydroxylase-like FAD-dependent oxidoreductase [Kutzneria kofuensis]
MRALISGAGVAGPALATALGRHGVEVTVVEAAAKLRTSGFAVDFRGETHMSVLAKLGVLDQLKAVQTHGGAMEAVDEHGRQIFRLPEEFAGGEVEVRRSDLSRILYERSLDHADYLFGDTITGLAETESGVHVDFAKAESRTYDIVIGADGMHSGVRRLVFGPERDYVKHLGYYIAGWDLVNDRGYGTTAVQYNVPGRMASVSADFRDPSKAGALFVFAKPQADVDWRDLDRQKRMIRDAFGGMRWHVPYLLDTLRDVDEMYFDSISRVRVPQWTKGRFALLGDAAWGVTLGGMGVGTGVVGAYVLAGELALARGDHRAAFAAYEQRMRGYAGRWQKGASPGQFLAPSTAPLLWLRNAMFSTKAVQKLMVAGTTKLAGDVALPDYPAA